MEMAVPMKAGIVNGISGNISLYLSVTKRADRETINTIIRSYFTLFTM
jgi:hypothetical protein